MRSNKTIPNAEEKRWLKAIAKHPCVVSGNSIIQIHHFLGRSAIKNKVDIGHWAILPLSVELHDISSNHPHNITLNKSAFEREYGSEKGLFMALLDDRIMSGLWIPNENIINAIMDY